MFDDLILSKRADFYEARELLRELKKSGCIIGTDEAGRGALAGSVVAAAVYLTSEQEEKLLSETKLRDSKRLTPLSREKIFKFMNEIGVLWRAGMGNVAMIDSENILRTSLKTMKNAVVKVASKLNEKPACVIVDGNSEIPELNFPQWDLIRADSLIPVVSAASIVAKVIRDRLMINLDKKYPDYNFAKNKGYPTQFHIETLKSIGMSEIHRKTFCRKILESKISESESE